MSDLQGFTQIVLKFKTCKHWIEFQNNLFKSLEIWQNQSVYFQLIGDKICWSDKEQPAVERNLEYVYDIDQLYNQSRLDPDETILQVVLKGSFLTSELTNLARHYLEISAVLKDDKGTIMLSLNQRFFRWINWNRRYQNEIF